MQERIAVYPTTADPPTIGHADILKRLAAKFDRIYWVAAKNPYKDPIFPLEMRLKMMDQCIQHLQLKNVIRDDFSGAIYRYAKTKNAGFLLRGLRNSTDFQSEIELANVNRSLDNSIETICIFANPELSLVSSSLVREFARLNEDYSKYVIPEVEALIKQFFYHQS